MIFRWPVRVYYEDTDAAGVVYYANYLRFLERARTEWLASLGFTLTALEAEHGVVFVVHRLDIEYRQPARLYDALVEHPQSEGVTHGTATNLRKGQSDGRVER